MTSNRPAYIHHVNFPTTDMERTKDWYVEVFGHEGTSRPKSNTKVVLMTRGNFDLHFTPVEIDGPDVARTTSPSRSRTGTDSWRTWMSLGIRHTRPIMRPENNSMFCYIHDPDHTMIELVYHHRRPYPPPSERTRPRARGKPARPSRRAPDEARDSAGQGRGGGLTDAVHQHRGRRPDLLREARRGPGGPVRARLGRAPRGLVAAGAGACEDRYTVITMDLRGFGCSDSGTG